MKIKLIIFLVFLSMALKGQRVPDNYLFTLQDVVGITGGTSLSAAFSLSISGYFDANYSGNTANSMRLFRNYGPPPASIPTVTTGDYSITSCSTVIANGDVVSDGGAAITAEGICWGTSSNPSIFGDHTHDGTSLGPFATGISFLQVNTVYHYRAYAQNSEGTAYGEDKTMTTALDVLPYAELTSVFLGIPNTYFDITWTQTNPTGSTSTIQLRIQNVTKSSGWKYCTPSTAYSGDCRVVKSESVYMGITGETGDSFDIEISSDGGLTWRPAVITTLSRVIPYDINH